MNATHAEILMSGQLGGVEMHVTKSVTYYSHWMACMPKYRFYSFEKRVILICSIK